MRPCMQLAIELVIDGVINWVGGSSETNHAYTSAMATSDGDVRPGGLVCLGAADTWVAELGRRGAEDVDVDVAVK